jgi:transposase-like protein
MQFKKDLLKGTVISKGYSMGDVARWLGINPSTLYRKIAKNGDFSRTEIIIIGDRLELKEQELNSIFFAE